MSEPETAEPTPEPEPAEPTPETEEPSEEPSEPSQEPQTDEPDEPEAPNEAEPAEPQPEPQGASQEEIEAAFKKLGKLDEHVASRVSQIMGDEAVNLVRCPVCTTIAPGWIYPPTIAPLEPAQIAGMRALMGIQDAADLNEHPAFTRCEACGGKAYVKTGSLRDGYESKECPTCNGLGYTQDLSGLIVRNGEQPAPLDTAPLVPASFTDELPADLAAYKAQGWLIAPPVSMPG